MKKAMAVLAAVLCAATVAHAGGNPHMVYGKVLNADGSVPPDGAVSFKASIAARPGETLTEKSDGCTYAGGWFQVLVGNFPSPWDKGETLKVEFTESKTGGARTLEHTLTLQDPDLAKDVVLEK